MSLNGCKPPSINTLLCNQNHAEKCTQVPCNAGRCLQFFFINFLSLVTKYKKLLYNKKVNVHKSFNISFLSCTSYSNDEIYETEQNFKVILQFLCLGCLNICNVLLHKFNFQLNFHRIVVVIYCCCTKQCTRRNCVSLPPSFSSS